MTRTYQDDATTPDVDLLAGIQAIAHDEFGRGIARAAAAGLHQVASPVAGLANGVQAFPLHEILVSYPVLHVLGEVVVGVEGVCKAEVGDDDVLVSIEE